MSLPSISQPRIIETSFRVRFAETDQMGIVHHATYLVYLEEGRSEFSRQIGASYRELEEAGYSLAVTDIHIRYHAPARYDQQITVRTWVEEMQSRGMRYRYEVVTAESGQLLVAATTQLICLDHEGRVRRLPAEWKARLEGKL